MKNPEVKVIKLDLNDEAGMAALKKELEETFAKNKEAEEVSNKLTKAMQVFTEENCRIADAYGHDRNAILRSSLHTFMDAVLEFDWNKYDFETHDIKQEG